MLSIGGNLGFSDLSRVTFFDGQRLEANDLNAAATVQRELRWLHNRSLHNWGIGLGFAVSGAKGDRQVQIGPGYAIDCQGREIILTESISKVVPARAGTSDGRPVIYYLVAAYPDDTRLAAIERRQGECGTDGAVRLEERAAIYWKAQGEQTVESGMEIVLAQATILNCQLAAPLSLEQRRGARAAQQPYVAAGATLLGQTPWELWTIQADGQPLTIGVKATVSTDSARFGTTPEYQAQLGGQNFFAGSLSADQGNFLLLGNGYVAEPARNSFVFNVLLPVELVGLGEILINPHRVVSDSDGLLKLVQENWMIVWVGVEG